MLLDRLPERAALTRLLEAALAVFRGRETHAAELIQTITGDAGRRGEGLALSTAQWAAAVLGNSQGRYEEALAAAQSASEDFPASHFAGWALAELIEAAARSAVPGRAAGALQRLSEIARACKTDWVLVSRPARGRWSATARPPRTSTARRSTTSAVLACAWTRTRPSGLRRVAAPPPAPARRP